jgi:predicted Rossmann fold nucleotide-binding protein DprA/Smf involved in DNA uptake
MKNPGVLSIIQSASDTGPLSWRQAIGDTALLDLPLVGLLCSIRLTGSAILGLYDLALALRNAGVPVIGGFHTPMERECLQILLRGKQPVVVCPARSMEKMRVPLSWRRPLTEGRLLALSSFEPGRRRSTAQQADLRNRMIVTLARSLIVGYAAPESRTEKLCREAMEAGKPVYTLDLPENATWKALGAPAFTASALAARLAFENPVSA